MRNRDILGGYYDWVESVLVKSYERFPRNKIIGCDHMQCTWKGEYRCRIARCKKRICKGHRAAHILLHLTKLIPTTSRQ